MLDTLTRCMQDGYCFVVEADRMGLAIPNMLAVSNTGLWGGLDFPR